MSVYKGKATEKTTEKAKEKGLGTRPFTTKNNPLGPILILTENQVNVRRNCQRYREAFYGTA